MRPSTLVLTLAAACAALPAAAAPRKGKAAPAKAPPPLNVTGKWEASAAGFYGQMRQTGGVIVGRCSHECAYEGKCDLPGIKQCYVRGAFLGDHVVLTTFATNTATSDPCGRSTFIAANVGKISPLVGSWRGEWSYGQDGITRTSADGGAWATYPYADELTRCGDVVTYELSFDVGSAVIKNPDAPVLAAMAELLKGTESKLRVVGHTDSTGSAEANKKLSVDRAGSVKARIVELSKADPGRIAVEGMGPDQPLETNDTPAGRALNRRVEITLGR
jgi:outer membrane protein OmpA-like peptidoglycan-associated protein